jgi:uncharacterized membrane protein YdbT with pleckstrin-like domain
MWDIESKYLQKDETIEYTDRPNMLSCIFSYVWVGLMAFNAIMMLIESIVTDNTPNGPSIRPIVLIYVVFALPGIYVILKRLSTRYAISNKGLLTRTGIITTSIKTVPYKHVTSIEVEETIIGKMFRYAHLLIDISGSGKEIEFRWKYVGAAHKVKKLIEKHVVCE